jgi:hypothetical protein
MNATAWRLMASSAVVCAALGAPAASAAISIQVLSSMPQLVTGGDALVRINGSTAAPAVTVEGKDVASAFSRDPKGGYIGLVSGLKEGSNSLVAKAGADQASVTLINSARPRTRPAPRRRSSNISIYPRPTSGSRSTPWARGRAISPRP